MPEEETDEGRRWFFLQRGENNVKMEEKNERIKARPSGDERVEGARLVKRPPE